jgi:hypothetical protein
MLFDFCFETGSITIKTEIATAWTVSIALEKPFENQWFFWYFYRDIPDFCQALGLENEPWYVVTKHFKQDCPMQAGVSNTPKLAGLV